MGKVWTESLAVVRSCIIFLGRDALPNEIQGFSILTLGVSTLDQMEKNDEQFPPSADVRLRCPSAVA